MEHFVKQSIAYFEQNFPEFKTILESKYSSISKISDDIYQSWLYFFNNLSQYNKNILFFYFLSKEAEIPEKYLIEKKKNNGVVLAKEEIKDHIILDLISSSFFTIIGIAPFHFNKCREFIDYWCFITFYHLFLVNFEPFVNPVK